MKNAAFTLRQAQGTAYNGDGQRVKSVMTTNLGTTTTYFVGAHYEVTDGVVTKYYYAGSQRIAMRTGGTLYYMLGDHLGSTSLVTDASGNVVSQQQYKSWGETRYASGNTPTKYQYTGQFSYESDFGLQFYNARWYDSSLGRFAQADSIIPGGVQGMDRYAYVNNSPINYTDPSGHRCVPEDECGGMSNNTGSTSSSFDSQYGISFEGMDEGNQGIVRTAVRDVARALLRDYNRECRWADDCESYSAAQLFNTVYGGLTFASVTSYTDPKGNVHYSGAITKNAHRIEFASFPKSYSTGVKTPEMAFREGVNNVVHELGHAFGTKWYRKDGSGYDPSGPYVNVPNGLVNNAGFYLYPGPEGASYTWRQHPCTSGYDCPSEVFADMFLGWTYGAWAPNQAGADRATFMNQNMGSWIVNLVSP